MIPLLIIIFVYLIADITRNYYSNNIRHAGWDTTVATQGSTIYRRFYLEWSKVKVTRIHKAQALCATTDVRMIRSTNFDNVAGTYREALELTTILKHMQIRRIVRDGKRRFRCRRHLANSTKQTWRLWFWPI